MANDYSGGEYDDEAESHDHRSHEGIVHQRERQESDEMAKAKSLERSL